MPAQQPMVPPASGGVITDKVLDQIIEIAASVGNRPISDAEGTLFLVTIPGCLEELQQWRRKAALVADIMAPDNLLMFPGVA
jgi:hypothetical protein